jgi:hypothetical protein
MRLDEYPHCGTQLRSAARHCHSFDWRPQRRPIGRGDVRHIDDVFQNKIKLAAAAT